MDSAHLFLMEPARSDRHVELVLIRGLPYQNCPLGRYIVVNTVGNLVEN